jgi:DnaA family protein
MRQLSLGVRLHDRAVFDSYLPGPNALAVSHLRERLQPGARGVTWLHGPAGSGKSHLLQAACAQSPGSGYFPLHMLLTYGPDVLEGAERLPLACLDDLQHIAGLPEWETALFLLYVELDARGGRLLLAADAPPATLPWRLPDLASRCAAATVFALQGLDEPQQREALRLRAQQRGLEMPEDCALYLQRHFPRDMSTQQALLERLDQASLAEQRRLTLPFLRSVLG